MKLSRVWQYLKALLGLITSRGAGSYVEEQLDHLWKLLAKDGWIVEDRIVVARKDILRFLRSLARAIRYVLMHGD